MSLLDSIPTNGGKAASTGGSLLDLIPSQLHTDSTTPNASLQSLIAPKTVFSAGVANSTPMTMATGATGSLFSVAKSFAQAVPRDFATIGVSTGEAAFNLYSDLAKQLDLPGKDLGAKVTGTQVPTGNLAWLLGDEPITGFASQAAKLEGTIKNSPFAQKTGLTQFATPLAIAGTVVGPAFDFTGFGEGESGVIKAITQSSDIGHIASVLQKIGVHEDLIMPFAEQFASMTDSKAVKDGLAQLSNLQATTKLTDLVATHAATRGAGDIPDIIKGPVAPAENLPSHMRAVEADAINQVHKNGPELVDEYLAKNGNVINTDQARELFPAYNANRTLSAAVHEPSSYIAKQAYEKLLETKKGTGNNIVMFTAGGTGAGKTTAIEAMEKGLKDYPIVYDTNLNSLSSSVSKIEQALKAGYQVKINFVYNDIRQALDNALNRANHQIEEFGSGRTVPISEHVGTHVGSQAVFKDLIHRYADNPNVDMALLDNSGHTISAEKNPLDFLTKKGYSKEYERELQDHLTQHVKDRLAAGSISSDTAKGFIGRHVDGANASGVAESGGRGSEASLRGGAKESERVLGKAGIKPDANPTSASTIEKKIVSQQFNKEKLNLSFDEEQGIATRLTALGLDTRGVRTFDDMKDAAERLGTDVKGLLKEVANNRITDKEVVGLRNLINNNVQLSIDLEKQLLDKPGDIELTRKLRIANVQTDEALKKLVKGGTEAGRTIAAYRITADRSMDPALWLSKAQKELGEHVLTDEHKAAILDLIGKKDRQGLAEYIAMLRSPSFAEKATTLWKAGLLTSFTTHLANIGGNITMGLLSEASNTASTGLDILASLVTKQRTTTTSLAAVAARARGAAEGVTDAAHYLKTGTYTDDLLTKYDLPKGQTFKNPILNGYTNAVFRSLGAEDIVFRQSALSASMERQAEVLAKNEGLSGAAAKARVGALLQEPTNEMIMRGIDAAEYETFNSDNVMAKMIRGAKNSAKRFGGVGGQVAEGTIDFVAPFVRTPTNVAARLADYSPAGFVKAMVRFANPVTRSQKNLVEDLGRAITGSGVMAFGAYLYQKGLMTGNAPTNPGDLATFTAEGKQANSIYLMGHWMNLNRLSPFGNLLALGANFENLAADKSGADLAFATAAAGVKGLTQQTFLQGVSSALDAVNDPEQNAQTYLNQAGASVVPAVIGRIASTIDPTKRVPDGVMQSIQAKLPFLSEALPAKRDVFGNSLKVAGGRFNLVDPFGSTDAVNDPLLKESERVGVNITQPSKTVAKTTYTNKEYSAVQIIRGQILHQQLMTLATSPDYEKATVAQEGKMFQKTIDTVNQAVSDQVFPALMIMRYSLPADTNPDVLKSLLTVLNAEPTFKQASVDKQSAVIKKLLTTPQK